MNKVEIIDDMNKIDQVVDQLRSDLARFDAYENLVSAPIAVFSARKLIGPFRNRYKLINFNDDETDFAVAKPVLHQAIKSEFGAIDDPYLFLVAEIASPSLALLTRDNSITSYAESTFSLNSSSKDVCLRYENLGLGGTLSQVVWGFVTPKVKAHAFIREERTTRLVEMPV